MMRVRACTIRCRCHSSCRRSRFSQLGTQIGGKSFFSNKLRMCCASCRSVFCLRPHLRRISAASPTHNSRSEEHTSELQSRRDLVCRLLLEKKKKKIQININYKKKKKKKKKNKKKANK